jgi:hypothetical protein
MRLTNATSLEEALAELHAKPYFEWKTKGPPMCL